MRSLLESPILSPLRSLSQTPVPKGPEIEEGFDISPSLTANDMDRYAAFLSAIRSEYANDPNVRDDPSFQGIGGIVFDVAEEDEVETNEKKGDQVEVVVAEDTEVAVV
ncbi:hypothetical protein CcaverHIS002_0204820 [Cutaneotrichosporon cavernicola]|uniref:Uncharacterized protein n=1 Tax=Cutaneotrichosporon cavernicola TaxID=279322 RepID=A0AA48IDN0_9TREE|nr:uncharacterized protein CcaverHIS019_0204780 [Cutaneotrichosporon cavernicola]BEI81322.1 hypothetical protein CcaverHIS002_0204820 [Cutaneotrichosporon cavernicola]BEI89116.1 hypothetical protein CcaverHIS019_0204780 [Cutaneotrichosporon cavernicola]BEI96893.1 hypothetical protein CcaverHIS631_0204820 [Cutaneotrichosporon cavernicola]